MFGLRSDGKRIKNIDPIAKIIPHIMSERHDSQNVSKYEVLCNAMDKFILDEKEKNQISFSYMHLVIAGIIRVIALRPQLNRFVMNGRIYKRKSIYVSFVVKKSLRDEVEETTIKLRFDGTENIYQIKEKIDDAISKNANTSATNSTDKLAKTLTCIPNIFLKMAMSIIKSLDKHGMLPKKVIAASPFHTTFFLTNLKSIKTDYIYHHLYDFGTTGLFISMGKEQYKPIVQKSTEISIGKIMTLGIVMDERFSDGFYFAKSLRLLKRILDNPQVLKDNLEKIVEDVD